MNFTNNIEFRLKYNLLMVIFLTAMPVILIFAVQDLIAAKYLAFAIEISLIIVTFFAPLPL